MASPTPDELYLRYVSDGDVHALAQVFDMLAPDLERLALKLVRQPEDAEELVQETFLTAIESSEHFLSSMALQPWLAGILVNRARNSRRASRRTVQAGRLTEREVTTPDAEVAEAEHRAAVSRALAELPESLRVVVEAKLEGLDNRQLAKSLDLSEGALRARLFRGMQRLRAALPSGLATLFAAVLLQSAGLARVRARVLKEARSRSGGTNASEGFSRIRSTTILVGLGGAIAIVIVIGGALLNGDSESRSAVQRNVSASRGSKPSELSFAGREKNTTGGRVPVEPSSLGTRPSTVDAPRFEGSTLLGRVVDQDGIGVPNAEVLAWNHASNKGSYDLRVETGEAGEFHLEGLAERFVIIAKTEALACSQGLRGERPAGSSAEGLEIELKPAQVLRGIVRSPGGAPVANAEVWASNGLGTRSIHNLTSVDGITTFRAGSGRTRTLANGEFELAGLPPQNVYLRAKSKPYLVYGAYHDVTEGFVEVELDAGLRIRGSVMDADGNPAAGARVRMWPFYGNVQTVDREVSVDPKGEFVLSSVLRSPGDGRGASYAIAVLFDGHAVEVMQPVVPVELGGQDVAIRLSREKTIAGRVVDLTGAPVGGVKVWIEGEREMNPGAIHTRRNTWENQCGLDDAITDVEGQFRFDKLYAGEFVVHVILSEKENLSLDREVDSGTEELEFVFDRELARRVVIGGRVTDSLTGAPIEAFNVISWSGADARDGISHGKALRGEKPSGIYELVGLREGEIAVSFSAEGYNRLRVEDRNYVIGVHTVDVALSPSRSLTVSVVESSGEVPRSGTVRAIRANGERVVIDAGDGLRRNEMRLVEGKAHLHGLPAEALAIQVEVAPFAAVEIPVDLIEPFEGELTVIVNRVEPVRLKLFVLLAGSDLDIPEVLTHWRGHEDPQNRAWVYSALWKARESLPKVVVEIAVLDSSERATAALTLTPLQDSALFGSEPPRRGFENMYRFEHDYNQFGPVSYGSFGESMCPMLDLSLPPERVRMVAKAEGYQLVDVMLDLSGLAGGEAVEALVLVPLIR